MQHVQINVLMCFFDGCILLDGGIGPQNWLHF